MKITATSWRKLISKQNVLIAATAAVVLLAVVVAWNSYTWRNYTAESDALYQETKQTALNQLKQIDGTADIQSLINDLATARDNLCQAPPLTGIRTSLSQAARDYQEQCSQRQQALDKARDIAGRMIQQLQEEGMIDTKAISEGLKATEEGDYAAQRAVWREAIDKIPGAAAEPSQRTEATKQAKEAYRKIIERYDAVVDAALESEDRAKFDDAIVELSEAYTGLEALADNYRSALRALAEQLYDATTAL